MNCTLVQFWHWAIAVTKELKETPDEPRPLLDVKKTMLVEEPISDSVKMKKLCRATKSAPTSAKCWVPDLPEKSFSN